MCPRILPILVGVGLLCGPGISGLRAQNAGHWHKVSRIESSRALKVERHDGTAVKGRFVRADEDGIVLLTKNAEVVIPRAEIQKITIQAHRRYLKGVVTGMSVAGAVATLKSMSQNYADEGRFFRSGDPPRIGIPIAVGGVLGAAIGSGESVSVYEAEKLQGQ